MGWANTICENFGVPQGFGLNQFGIGVVLFFQLIMANIERGIPRGEIRILMHLWVLAQTTMCAVIVEIKSHILRNVELKGGASH